MHKWEVHVEAGPDFVDFANHFNNRHLSFSADHDEHTGHVFSAFSHHFDHIDEGRDLSNRIYSFELLINGARRISLGSMRPPRISFMGYGGGNGLGRYSVEHVDENPFDSPVAAQMTHFDGRPRRYGAAYYLDMAANNEAIRTALFLAGQIYTASVPEKILSWATLYKLYDTCRWMMKEIGVALVDLETTSGELNSFTAACNNMSVLGLSARHGRGNNPPPLRVMTDLNSAIDMMLRVGNESCRKYADVVDPP